MVYSIDKKIYNCIRLLHYKLTQEQLFEVAKFSYNGYIHKCIELLLDKLTTDQVFELAKLSYNWKIDDCIKLLNKKLTPDQLFEVAKLSNSLYIKDLSAQGVSSQKLILLQQNARISNSSLLILLTTVSFCLILFISKIVWSMAS